MGRQAGRWQFFNAKGTTSRSFLSDGSPRSLRSAAFRTEVARSRADPDRNFAEVAPFHPIPARDRPTADRNCAGVAPFRSGRILLHSTENDVELLGGPWVKINCGPEDEYEDHEI